MPNKSFNKMFDELAKKYLDMCPEKPPSQLRFTDRRNGHKMSLSSCFTSDDKTNDFSEAVRHYYKDNSSEILFIEVDGTGVGLNMEAAKRLTEDLGKMLKYIEMESKNADSKTY